MATTNCSIQATFAPIAYTVSATASPGGSIVAPATVSLPHGALVTFTALPDEHFVFGQWLLPETSDCRPLADATHPEVTFTVGGNCQLEAQFMKAPRTITTSADEDATITPSLTVDHGQEVTIRVTLEAGTQLRQWSGDCGAFAAADTELRWSATKDCTLHAVVEKTRHTLVAAATEGGSIREPSPRVVTYGQMISWTAVADATYGLVTWQTDGSSDCPEIDTPTQSTITFLVQGDCVLQAVFEQTQFTITTQVRGSGGTITPSLTATKGATVSIEVMLEETHELQQWQGDCGTFEATASRIEWVVVQDCTVEAILGRASPLYWDANGLTIRSHPWGEQFIGQRVPPRMEGASPSRC
ncbi:MAG: hypothetical protein OXC61_09435 [Flavobacteriaceae bacterium]|nr:hypothetical protein [Flavobacteriaceae bacterium]